MVVTALLAVLLHGSPSHAAEEQATIEVEVEQGLLTVHSETTPLANILRIIGEKGRPRYDDQLVVRERCA